MLCVRDAKTINPLRDVTSPRGINRPRDMTCGRTGFSRQQIQREIGVQIKRPRAQRLFKLRTALRVLDYVAGFFAQVRHSYGCRLRAFSDG
ncbi:hypothetical protein CRSA0334_17245 [Cronobacter malonaticus ENBT0334]|nr:hypothetical protein CRSA0334_17245 [Cronobacter malonaticus ENBT0334]